MAPVPKVRGLGENVEEMKHMWDKAQWRAGMSLLVQSVLVSISAVFFTYLHMKQQVTCPFHTILVAAKWGKYFQKNHIEDYPEILVTQSEFCCSYF